jgi:hypothetical protein
VPEQYANNAQSTLTAALTAGATSLSVASAGSFPSSGNFRLLIDQEILLVTAVSGNTFTVSRGQEGTTAAGHANGAYVTHVLTAAALLVIPAYALLAGANTFTVAPQQITIDAAGHVGLVIKAAAAQSADLQQWQSSAGTTRARITSAQELSNTGGATSSEQFGAGATVNGLQSSTALGASANIFPNGGDVTGLGTAVGYNASAMGHNCTALGANSLAGAVGNGDCFALGYSAQATGSQSVALGSTSTADHSQAIAVGYSAAAQQARAIALGYAVTVSQNQGVGIGYGANVTASGEWCFCSRDFTPTLHFQTNSSTSTVRNVGGFVLTWATSTDATRKGRIAMVACDSTGTDREGLRVESDGTQSLIGFYGATAIARAVLATGAGHTVDDVITALQNLGLVKQS